MSLRVRMGPFSVSSRGRVGVSAGPVSWSGGGSRSNGSDFGSLMALVFFVGIVVVVVMWPLSLWGHALHLTPSWHQLMNRDKAWMHEHYPLVGLRYLGAAVLLAIAAVTVLAPALNKHAERASLRAAEAERARIAEYQRWLQSPPPPITFPGRFTQNWLEANVRLLHPGQVPQLIAELRARGWTEDRIAQRVSPLLTNHPV